MNGFLSGRIRSRLKANADENTNTMAIEAVRAALDQLPYSSRMSISSWGRRTLLMIRLNPRTCVQRFSTLTRQGRFRLVCVFVFLERLGDC
jgi:hypothetical protein